MKAYASIRTALLLAAALVLTACGGGGGSDDDSGFNPPGIRISASPSSLSMNTNSASSITVRVTQASGAVVADGTTVTGTVNSVGAGNISALGSGGSGATSSGTTVGGNVTFLFQSGGQPGSTSLTFSANDPNTNRNATTNTQVTINSGPSNDPRISFQSTATTLPANPYFEQGYVPFIGSPYVAEISVQARSATGQPFSGDDAELAVAITPVEVAAFSTLDRGDTEENDFEVLLGTGPVEINAGQATIFVHSLSTPGTATLTVSFVDPDTQQQVSGQLEITIAASAPPLPGNVTIGAPQQPVYVQGSGGNNFAPFTVRVEDGSGEEVPDPLSGNNAFNNVRIEIIGDGVAAGERITGVNAQGQNVEGAVVSLRTNNGIANATFRAGTRLGTTLIRATADRADNNVDNGITDPVVAERSIAVSDGRLFDIEITQPSVNALFVNPFSEDVVVDAESGISIPPEPDGTYSLTIGVIATDRLGNPVLPGTLINFGLIDEPQEFGFGDFYLSGTDGNPQEAGTLFTAPGGAFLVAGGGAGPGDALVVFGEEVVGNRDLESARVVSNINSNTSLTVTRRFNNNDDTGVSENYGPILPYVIGRAADGNINALAATDANGVATTRMNYPVSRLGKRVVIWAQGDGDLVGSTPETVTDAEFAAFAAAAPISVVASPSAIPANTTALVTVCVFDALQAPISNVFVGFGFEDLDGSGSVDGTPNSGTVGSPTGQDGCTVASVTTGGVLEGGEPLVVFSVGGASDEVEITLGSLILQAQPSILGSTGGGVTLTLINGQGEPQPGFQIVGTCETSTEGASIGISSGPGVTNASGQTTATVIASNMSQPDVAGTGTCTFETADGAASTTVTVRGQDLCSLGFSPPPPGCEDPDAP